VLSGMAVGASGYVRAKARRSRTEVEIVAISTALENYRVDNGAYPTNAATSTLSPVSTSPFTYRTASSFLYSQLTGDDDANPLTPTTSNSRDYFGITLKPGMLAPNPPGAGTYLQDPFGNSYGYSTMKAENPNSVIGNNPTFDLWSTANSNDSAEWVKNW
jgi:type II secretory pathway pseudopilin PulG